LKNVFHLSASSPALSSLSPHPSSLPSSPKLPATISLPDNPIANLDIKRLILCRICEEMVLASELESHSKSCIIRQEYQLKAYTCNLRIKKLISAASSLREKYLVSEKILELPLLFRTPYPFKHFFLLLMFFLCCVFDVPFKLMIGQGDDVGFNSSNHARFLKITDNVVKCANKYGRNRFFFNFLNESKATTELHLYINSC